MPINFHDPNQRFTYTNRTADSSWLQMMDRLADWEQKKVIDLGCGGGVYSKALLELGATSVIGVDFSAEMLKGAQQTQVDQRIQFHQGNAYETGLDSEIVDIVFQRALIHHLSDLTRCFTETKRLLRPEGITIIQNRTPEDCLLPGSRTHIRGYFFEKFPQLSELETKRRYTDEEVQQSLITAGFHHVASHTFWEIRKTYTNFAELEQQILNRVGRSILHECSDEELRELVEYIKGKIGTHLHEPLVEQDRWTIWTAYKPSKT